MKRLLDSLTLAITLTSGGAGGSADHAAEVVPRAAINAQGGEQALRALRSVEFEAVGYRSMVEQSERLGGPFVTEFDCVAELHDLTANRSRRTLKATLSVAEHLQRIDLRRPARRQITGDQTDRRQEQRRPDQKPRIVRAHRQGVDEHLR